jgi:hypothetical protein
MNSPGHRANLLTEQFSHVGFGTATDQRGQTLVVQVLGFQPFRLVSAALQTKQRNEYAIQLTVSLPQGGNVIFSYGQQVSEPMFLEAGTQALHFSSSEAGKIFVQVSILAASGDSYIIQDGGWLELASGEFVADQLTPKTYVSILSASASAQLSTINEVTLTFDGASAKQLAALVNQTYQPDAVVSPGIIRLAIPAALAEPEIAVGEIAGDRVNFTHLFSLSQNTAFPVVIAKSVD